MAQSLLPHGSDETHYLPLLSDSDQHLDTKAFLGSGEKHWLARSLVEKLWAQHAVNSPRLEGATPAGEEGVAAEIPGNKP